MKNSVDQIFSIAYKDCDPVIKDIIKNYNEIGKEDFILMCENILEI